MSIGNLAGLASSVKPPPLPAVLPFRHVGATAGRENSSFIYLYYQANDTHFGEISFDNDAGVWSAEPVFIAVT